MKKILCLVMFLCLIVPCAWADVTINATNFPDNTFRSIVSGYDTNGDGTLSDAEIAAVTRIDVNGTFRETKISSLQGIEYFTALTDLDCGANALTSLNVSQNTALRSLQCYNNKLKALDVSRNTALTALDCGYTQLTDLDVSANIALDSLLCEGNELTALNVSRNAALAVLFCDDNLLTELDVSANTALWALGCNGNQLTTLDISENTELESLRCDFNLLKVLDVSRNTALSDLSCSGNQLTDLDLSNNPALKLLQCGYNRLTALDLRSIPTVATGIMNQIIKNLQVVYQPGDGVSTPYRLDFSDYISSEQINNIDAASVRGVDENNSEIETIYANGVAQFAARPDKVLYRYDTGITQEADNIQAYLDVTITDWDYGVISLNNHVYRLIHRDLSWQNAKEYCEALGGHLATVSNTEERNLIQDLIASVEEGGYYWLGGEKVEDTWRWITDEEFSVTINESEYIASMSSDVVVIISSAGGLEGERLDYGDVQFFVCEWEPVESEFAPVNPEYLRYIADPEAYFEGVDFYGLVPDPLDFSHLESNPPQIARIAALLPSEHDPRSSGRVPEVRDQGSYGTCWSFASLGALEASYLAQGLGSTAPNLSELHQAWFVYKDPRPGCAASLNDASESILNQGGSNSKSIAFLSRAGAASENDLPYERAGSVESLTAGKLPEDYEHPLLLKAAYRTGSIGQSKRDTIKNLVLQYGAVSIAYRHSNGYLQNNSYYMPSNEGGGHAVNIVGWDDNYSRTNFGTQPDSDGAWLVKNSWGTGWGDRGFFWMSYKQAIFDSAVYIAAAKDTGGSLYGHDSFAAVASIPYSWSANVFKAGNAETLREVAFYTRDNNVPYEIYVNHHDTVAPENPGLPGTAVASGTMPYAGYHTVTLDSPVSLEAGKYFSVIVKLAASSSYSYVTAAENDTSVNIANVATAGKSYFAKNSATPEASDWQDGKRILGGSYNACIKAFTGAGSGGDSDSPAITTAVLPSGTVGLYYMAPLSASGSGTITWTATGLPDGLEVSGNSIVGTPSTAETCNVTIQASNSYGTDSKTLTLEIKNASGPSGGGGGGCEAGWGGFIALGLAAVWALSRKQ